jgi:hypothetical protein
MTEGNPILCLGTASDLHEAIRRIVPIVNGSVITSSAAHDEVQNALIGFDLDLRPTVRGRTVWGTIGQSWCVVVSPNRYGVTDNAPADIAKTVLITEAGFLGPVLVQGRVCALDEVGSWHVFGPARGATGSAPSFDDARERFVRRTRQARRLAKGLSQIKGLYLAHGVPDSPRFVVLLPVNPVVVVERLSVFREIQSTSNAAELLPGAVTVTVTGDPDEGDHREYVEAMSVAVASTAYSGGPRP